MKKIISKIAGTLLGLSLVVGTGVMFGKGKKNVEKVSAATATFGVSDFSGQGTANSGSEMSATVDGVTISTNKGYGTTEVRFYQHANLTISSSYTITGIAFTFSGGKTGGLETSYTGLSTNSWEQTDLASQMRFTECVVTYSSGVSYEVTFNLQGHGDSISSQQIETNGKVTKPSNPTDSDYLFKGWFKESTCDNAWDFDTDTITGTTTLYAKWVEKGDADTFEKITENQTDWSGDYLIVYEADTETAYVWDGTDSVSDYVEGSIVDGKIVQPEGTSSVTISSITDGYSIKVNGGTNDTKYIYGKSGDNTLNFGAESLNTISFDSGADIVSLTSHLRFNTTSGQTRFRYYKAASYTGAVYKVPQLYKLVEDSNKISLSVENIEMMVGGSPVTPVVKNAADSTQIITGCSFVSNNTAVVDFVNGQLVAIGKGTASVTVSHADDTTDPTSPISYKSTTFTVTVSQLDTIETVVTACKALGSSGTTAESYTIQGTVTGNYSSGDKKNYMIQQGSYGMYLFNTGVDLVVGDVARATGTFGRYNNWIESKSLTSVVKVSAEAESISPVVITSLDDLTDDYQNTLVTFQGLNYSSGTPGSTDTSITFKLGDDDLILRTTVGIADETNINAKINDAAEHKTDSTFNLVGVHYTVFNSAKQFKVDNSSKIQRIPNGATTTEIVQSFVDSCMHLTDIPVSEESRNSSTTACSATGGYYEVAKAALTSLGDEAIAEFKGNDTFNDAQERYESWAEIYGDATPYSPEFTPVSGSAHGITANQIDNNTSTIIIVVVALTSITSIGVLLVIKRKRSLVK